MLGGGNVDPTYVRAVADLIVEAGKSAEWLAKFCCSREGLERGVALKRRIEAVENAELDAAKQWAAAALVLGEAP